MNVSTSAGDFEINILYETTLGTGETNSTLGLYPNPVNDVFTISGTELQSIMVFNTLGQKVYDWTGNDREVRFSTDQYENGLYFVKVNGEKTLRFVVAH